MNEPIIVNSRAAGQIEGTLKQVRELNAHLQTYIEALGAALDVPPGWRFDPQIMAFVPPPDSQARHVAELSGSAHLPTEENAAAVAAETGGA